MPKESRYDRQVRMFKIEHLLYQCGEAGMLADHVAELCDVSLRTTQRDLNAIEASNVFPIWRDKGRCGISMKRYLPPIHFSPSEALNLFMASRLMLGYAQRYDPDIASIFTKLNCVLPSPLKEQGQKTIEWMNTLPKNSRVVQILGRLAEAWITGRIVHISYQSYSAEEASERDIDVYYIQPVSIGHSAYVIGYCHYMKKIRTFKVERIESLTMLPERYDIPRDFDANKHLSSAWGIVTDDKVETIKLRIMPELVRLMEETVWHPSQIVKRQKDGSAVMTLQVANTWELVTWILGWGEKVEVLEPEGLRGEIADTVKMMDKVLYKKRQKR
jgi:predicted DNA-binding transcriptional regulator YafY